MSQWFKNLQIKQNKLFVNFRANEYDSRISQNVLFVSFHEYENPLHNPNVGIIEKMLEGFYLADHRVNFPNFGSFLISFLHSEKIKIFKNWYVVITTRITVTRDCNKIFLKSNYQKIFEIQIFFRHLKNTKSCHVILLIWW